MCFIFASFYEVIEAIECFYFFEYNLKTRSSVETEKNINHAGF